jgi:selenide,water dikinase
MSEAIRLTQTVKKGGCAAKIPARELRKILSSLKFPTGAPELLVDGSQWDDAAIYAISDSQALVQTLDFFTPIVDSPRLFGKVAAANAMSDVYAMGGIPKTCLAILAYPSSILDNEIIREVLQGACDIIETAKAHLVGGHSIDDDTLKFGLSVTGLVDRDQIWTNAGARLGDVLILTKALGTGTLSAGLKRGAYTENEIQDALSSMSQLNNIPALLEKRQRYFVHSATDITGFGFSGHSCQMAAASKVSFEIEARALPFFEKAKDSLKQEHLTKAHATNREYTKDRIQNDHLDSFQNHLIHDPQTSGGLLLSVAPDAVSDLIELIKPTFSRVSEIGRVIEKKDKDVLFA